jgi:ATP-dependent helicase/nuclease subunit A
MEMARDEVRVMTVHGAKGLEANTVILADTTTPPAGSHPPRLLTLSDGALVWATAQANDTAAMSDARAATQEAARDEYKRLLYVAMTRAAERLVVCGTQGDKKIPDGCWYQLVSDALASDCANEPADDGDGEVLRYRKIEPPEPVQTVMPPTHDVVVMPPPAWLTKDVRPETPSAVTIAPSTATEEAAAVPAAGAPVNMALLRGSLVHRLLQALPDIPPDRRRAAARDYLARTDGLDADECAQIVEKVMRVLDDARFRALFQPGSRAEVPIVGRLDLSGRPVRVSGQIDRLAVTETEVLIADFKTNRPPPRRIEDVPRAYVTQLALYRALLARLYPEKTVRAALVWTEASDLMELSSPALDAALSSVTGA